MIEKLTITVLNESLNSEELMEINHDSELENRDGYDEGFLGINLPLPKPKTSIENSIAKNVSQSCKNQYYLDYMHFSIMFNKDKKLPYITAVNIEGKTNELAMDHESREGDKWFQDDRINVGGNNFQFGDSDYLYSGFQKGHLVRYYDPAWGENASIKKIAKGDTFYYTNCCPQIAGFNTVKWLNLENYTMARAIFENEKVTVFSGPIFNKSVVKGNLIVPINFWKILVYQKDDSLEAMGFLLSQEIAYTKMFEELAILEKIAILEEKVVKPTLTQADIDRLFNKKDLKRYMVKIELIEEKTGLDFGLNEFDINKDKNKDFYLKTEGEFEKITEKERMLEQMYYKSGQFEEQFNDLKFISEI